MKCTYYILIILLLGACNDSQKSLKKKEKDVYPMVLSYYAQKCYASENLLWYRSSGELNQNGTAFYSDLEQAHHEGLFPEFYYQQIESKSLALKSNTVYNKDRVLTEVACMYLYHLKYGVFNDSLKLNDVQFVNTDLNQLELFSSSSYQDQKSYFYPDSYLFSKIVNATKAPFFNQKNFDDIQWDLSYAEYQENKDSITTFLKKTVPYEDWCGETNFNHFLADFQKYNNLNVDSLLGKHSIQKLNVSNLDRFLTYVITLDQIKKETLNDSLHLLVNIPAFKVQLWKNGMLNKEHKVIVGTLENQTPELDAKVAYVETLPFWTVPFSISSKEILHHIKKDSTYLERNNFDIFNHANDQIAHQDIKWDSVSSASLPYVFRQKGGDQNALGFIKIIFPNEHAVYLHDTPSRGLFNKEARTFSHGCMRLHDPVEFAAHLLSLEGGETDPLYHLDSLINNKINKIIPLKNKIDISVRYYLVGVSEENHIQWYTDCYDKKSMLLTKAKQIYLELVKNDYLAANEKQSGIEVLD